MRFACNFADQWFSLIFSFQRHDSPLRRGIRSIFSLRSLAHTSGYNFRGETSGKIQRDIVERFCANKAMLFSTPYLKAGCPVFFQCKLLSIPSREFMAFMFLWLSVPIFDQDYFLDFIKWAKTRGTTKSYETNAQSVRTLFEKKLSAMIMNSLKERWQVEISLWKNKIKTHSSAILNCLSCFKSCKSWGIDYWNIQETTSRPRLQRLFLFVLIHHCRYPCWFW